MVFPITPTRVPTKIGTIRVLLQEKFIPAHMDTNLDTKEEFLVPEAIEYSVIASIEVLDQFDQMLATWKGNIIPYLTDPQKDGLLNFMEVIRIKAENEILG